jgi:hypothetical protein
VSIVEADAFEMDELGASTTESRGLSLRWGDAEAGNKPVGTLAASSKAVAADSTIGVPARV